MRKFCESEHKHMDSGAESYLFLHCALMQTMNVVNILQMLQQISLCITFSKEQKYEHKISYATVHSKNGSILSCGPVLSGRPKSFGREQQTGLAIRNNFW